MMCDNCGNGIGSPQDGDVTMCTRCGQWYETSPVCTGPLVGTLIEPELETSPITPKQAACYAEAPVPSDVLLRAMEENDIRLREQSQWENVWR